MQKQLTEAAQVAKLLRTELKEKFPGVKFSVTSENYSMGDNVQIRYTATRTTPKVKDVEKLTLKFNAGHFDSTTDCYEYTNRGTGPTSKYIFVDADTTELKKEVLSELLTEWGFSQEDFTNDALVKQRCGVWPDQLMWRFLTENYI